MNLSTPPLQVVDNIQQSFYWVEEIKLYGMKMQRVQRDIN